MQRSNGIGFIRLHIPWPILSREAELQKIKVPVKKVSSSTPSFNTLVIHILVSVCIFLIICRRLIIWMLGYYSAWWEAVVAESWYMNGSAQVIIRVSMFSLSRSVNCGNGWALLEYGIPLPLKSTHRFNQTSLILTSTETHRQKSTSKPSNTLLSETSSTCKYLYCHTHTHKSIRSGMVYPVSAN